MKEYLNSVLLLVIGFLVSLVLNSTLIFLTQDRGVITLGPPIGGVGQHYMPVDITNFRDELIDGLVLSIPVSTAITSTLSSSPIQLELVDGVIGTGDRQRIKVSGIEPRQITRLQFPIESQTEAGLVQVVNASELRLSLTPTKNLLNPLWSAVWSALGYALITGLFYGIGYFWSTSRFTAQHKKMEEKFDTEHQRAMEEFKKFNTEQGRWDQKFTALEVRLGNADAELERSQRHSARIQLLLLARLSDYTKELDFWRNTIRKILYQSIHNEQAAEVLIKEVTNSLKTYSTLKGGPTTFDTIKMLEVYMTSSNNESSTRETKQE